MGVFPANQMNRFIDYKRIISNKGKCPFIIAKTGSSDKYGTHWWAILEIEQQTDLFW